jgi:hypothetical protein
VVVFGVGEDAAVTATEMEAVVEAVVVQAVAIFAEVAEVAEMAVEAAVEAVEIDKDRVGEDHHSLVRLLRWLHVGLCLHNNNRALLEFTIRDIRRRWIPTSLPKRTPMCKVLLAASSTAYQADGASEPKARRSFYAPTISG